MTWTKALSRGKFTRKRVERMMDKKLKKYHSKRDNIIENTDLYPRPDRISILIAKKMSRVKIIDYGRFLICFWLF